MNGRLKTLLMGAALGLALMFATGTLFTTVSNNSESLNTASASANAARVLARQTRDFASRIQAERVRNMRDGCKAQNKRHWDAVRFIDGRIAKLRSRKRVIAKANRTVMVAFITTLAPLQNCDKVVERETRPDTS